MGPDDQVEPAAEVARIGADPGAFETFYRAYVEAVQNFVARRVSDPYLVADLTAEVFLAAIDAAVTYRQARGTPIAWLYGIARRIVASEYRRGEREHRAVGRLAGRRLVDDDDIARLEQRIDSHRQARLLYQSLDLLSDGERAVLELVALDGLTVAQAAQALGIAGVSARVRLHRARRLLRGQLEGSTERSGGPAANPTHFLEVRS
ncbi:RNA polymerase sigma factor [Phytohabitans rumicis]|uniref:DNA-directed RNA polymerase sigma-70 factor n=1 Tax=Phytohabitans rumicis TaxID=1076125 RepID=A0A6V8KTB2_9ACTN|nr:RNA polymerase sigma factor [Phytohabitans rumicis]GFJ86670.1 DNA-directed RNA polymerase sigma-70 factor [Phytohabitans rumicis]